MARDRLRSNVQVRTAGVDPSIALLVVGLIVSAIVLLTMLGVKPDSRRSRSPFDEGRRGTPATRGDF